jgi:CHAD domain-containing protein
MSATALRADTSLGAGQTTPGDLGLPAEPVVATPKDPPAAHVRAKLDGQLRILLAREPGTRSGADPEDLHQMRVAVRRLRSVLKLSGDVLGPDAEPVRGEFGWLGAVLGEVRDYDVLIEHLRDIVAGFPDEDQVAAQRLVRIFVADRGKAKRRLTRALGSARYATLLRSAAQLTRIPEHENPAPLDNPKKSAVDNRQSLVSTLRKPYRKFGKAVDALPEDPPDDELHALRIRGKRLRYAAELAKPAVRKKQAKDVSALVKATRRLQDVLGDHQDAVVAADRMRTLAADGVDPEVGFVAGRIAERELGRRTRARENFPKAVADIHQAAAKLLE